MKTQSITLSIASSLVAFGFLFFLIKIAARKFRPVIETDSGTKRSYGIHVSGLLVGGCVILAKSLPLISEGFEIQWAQHSQSFVLDALQFVAAILGFSFLWIAGVFFIVQAFSSVLFGQRDQLIEMERDNLAFFGLKAMAFVGLSLVAAAIVEPFLRIFMPSLEGAFYH